MKLEQRTVSPRWNYIPGFEGLYEISDSGIVRSRTRSGSSGKELKQHEVRGYMRVYLSKNNKVQRLSVHRAVLMAFDRLPDDGEVCNHKDGNRVNNHLENLEWCTREENERHKQGVLGQDSKGAKNSNYRLRKKLLYPSDKLRNKLCELGIPKYKHNIAELGEMLPERVRDEEDNSTYRLNCHKLLNEWYVGYRIEYKDRSYDVVDVFWSKNEADARAKTLIYLIENGLFVANQEKE